MKPWLIALTAATGAFFLGVAVAIEVLVFLPMPEPARGVSIAWDPVSFFHNSGWQALFVAALIAAATFGAVYRHFSIHQKT